MSRLKWLCPPHSADCLMVDLVKNTRWVASWILEWIYYSWLRQLFVQSLELPPSQPSQSRFINCLSSKGRYTPGYEKKLAECEFDIWFWMSRCLAIDMVRCNHRFKNWRTRWNSCSPQQTWVRCIYCHAISIWTSLSIVLRASDLNWGH